MKSRRCPTALSPATKANLRPGRTPPVASRSSLSPSSLSPTSSSTATSARPFFAIQLLCDIPLALVGGLVFIRFTLNNISIPTLVGLIAVAGVADRNRIMSISRHLPPMRHEGEGFTKKMVIRRTEGRLVPVLMTAPTGGKLITAVGPHFEFFVNKDGKVEIRFIDDEMKVVAPGAQVVSVTLGDRSAPTKLTFSQDGDKLISDKVIPEGNNPPTVVQIKESPDAKSVNEKFNLNLDDCPTCKYREYTCTCDHE